eukprot:TRINITY_DN7493_c0_g1_i1.p1 TRINITY_DN7493_c0_g1~~TRINITY_DN7493_c0_g1_i1.p1  ORF type:complete len:399 (+),score=75.76 TRINITY_DN7493_c0_g1_i1:90-1286(+)
MTAPSAEQNGHRRAAAKTAWGLHDDQDGQGQYYYCQQIDLSTWVRHIDLPAGVTPEAATDEQLWCALVDRQIRDAFKMCATCASARETWEDPFFICGTCLRHCHLACSQPCSAVVCTEIWEDYAPYLRSCDVCDRKRPAAKEFVDGGPTADQLSAQAALNRLKSVQMPHQVRESLQAVEEQLGAQRITDGAAMDRICEICTDHYCPRGSHRLFKLAPSPKGGIGVFTAEDVPKLTRVGIYPGYPDPLSGEQSNRGRPTPKYALAEFNAADYYNHCFPELRGCLTQFINEPGPKEASNVAWLQEQSPVIEDGRLSIVTVRDLKAGEELHLSYGPLYPRDYPYAYDAYSFHLVEEGQGAPDVYALWYYASRESEAECKMFCKFDQRAGIFRECNSAGVYQ